MISNFPPHHRFEESKTWDQGRQLPWYGFLFYLLMITTDDLPACKYTYITSAKTSTCEKTLNLVVVPKVVTPVQMRVGVVEDFMLISLITLT